MAASAMRRLRSLAERITVISSTADRALEVSRRLAGGVTRVGAATRDQLETARRNWRTAEDRSTAVYV